MKLKKAAVTALAVITLLGAFPVQVFAEEPAEPIAAAEESAAGETAADEVVGSESIAEEPAEQEGSESVAEEPAEQESAAEEPALSESAVEEPAEPTEIEETVILTDAFSTVEEVIPGAASMTDEEAFAGYVASVFYPQEPQLSEAADASYLAGSALTGMDRRIYNVLASRIRQVASGQEASTSFSFTLDSGRCTAATLGLPSLGTFPELSEEAEAALWVQMSFDLSRVLDALLADMPYDLYWYDKTAPAAVSMEEGNSVMDGSEGEEIYSINFPVNYTIEMPVSEAYAGAAEYTTDSTRLASVRTAAANAAAIVQAHSGETDLAKLMRYRDAICDLTDYNQAAAGDSSTPYGDPWQLIYVFDGDPSTTVVCEGYSKAFKYLCDISEFSSPLIYARLATGYMAVGNESGEDHMWNVLAMPDGRNYLVDVTNTDDGIGSDHSLFLNGYESVSADGRTYGFACLAEDDVFYIYDDDTLSTFSASDLQLSAADYDGSAATPINISGSAVVSDIPDRVYDGTEQRPEVTVTYEGETLSAGTDYSVAYQNNVNAGTADVTIVFCGNYSGMIFTHFTITKAVYDMSGVSFTTTYRTYNGAEQNMRVTGTLPAGVTVSYTGNGQTELGRYPVTAHFSGDSANYEPIADMTSTLVIVRDTVEFYGRWGENHDYVVTYSIEDNYRYTLTVSGSGDIPDGQGPKEGIMATVIITDGVTGIGAGNFSQFWNLESITIPESVTRIGDRAFYTDSSLSSITLPENVTQIGKEAFYGCSGLTTIVVPEGTQEIGEYCFRNCTGLREVTLPGTLTEVRDGTFYDCTGLESIVIPESVARVGNYAFAGCAGLRSAVIPDTVTSIGDRAFYGCSSLETVTIPNSVTTLGAQVFYNCTGLETVYYTGTTAEWFAGGFHKGIPEGVEIICSDTDQVAAYGTCGEDLHWVLAGEEHDLTLTIVGTGEMTNYENGGPWSAYGSDISSVVILEGVTSIGNYAFANCRGITSAAIPESLDGIGDSAFINCVNLTQVSLPEDLRYLGNETFKGCTSLTSITLPGYAYYDLNGTFENCTALQTVVVSEGVTDLGEYFFSGCTSLREVTLPSTLRQLKNGTFSGCSSLESIVIPEGVTSIDTGAFSGCTGLKEVTISQDTFLRGRKVFRNCSSLETVYYIGTEADWADYRLWEDVPEGVRVICSDTGTNEPMVGSGYCGENLKWVLRGSGNDLTLTISGTGAMTDWDGSRVPWNSYLSGISAVVIEEGATTIGNEAFKNCTALTSVAIPDSVTHIGDSAFRGCSSLAGITLPESLTYLGDVAFQGCTALTSITLPESITSVGSSTFAGCTGLTSIAIPEGVRTIYELAFSGCTGLCEIILPEGLRTIEYGAFQGCSGLTSITIPKTVTTIRGSQFNGCTGLETIYYTGTEAEWAAAGFQALIPDGVAVICSDSAIPASGILLNVSSHDMFYGERFTLVATIVPENAADRTVVWTSDRETVAAVEDGVVIARGVGSAVITASVPNSGVSASCTVRVSAKDLTGLAEIADIPELVYNGEAQRPAVSVTYEGEPLRFGDDYTVEYSNNTNAGTAEAVLRFRGNYTGTASAHFTILPAENRWVTPLSCGDVLFGQTPRPSAAAAHGTPVFTYGTSADGPFVSEVPSSVGMYYVRAEVDGGGNYQSLSDVTSFGIQFTDVTDTSAFYYPPVYWAVDGGITTGYSDGTFRPWNTCNRAAVVTFLWRLAGSPAQDTNSVPFRDMTGNSDFDQAIIWAVSKGITTGYSDNTFRPWSTCSRAAIVTFLWRYLGQPAAPAGYRADFTDMTGNSDFDAAIAWAAANGITTGWTEANGTSTFRPWNTCNRASVVTFLWRMANLDG